LRRLCAPVAAESSRRSELFVLAAFACCALFRRAAPRQSVHTALVGAASARAPCRSRLALAFTPQVHLSYTGDFASAAVDWVQTALDGSLLRWSADANFGTYTDVKPTSGELEHTYNSTQFFVYQALLRPLDGKTTYYYKIQNLVDGSWSDVFSFRLVSDREPIAMIMGDQGLTNDQSLPAMIADAEAGAFDWVRWRGGGGGGCTSC
jgi:hypothetical protein